MTYWAPSGQKLATYQLVTVTGQSPSLYANQTGTYYYFGGRLFKNESGWVYPDRLGSIGKFYPYGTERPSATTNGTEKFTGYFRDAETGNDYAMNRYELPGQGRFMTPDPYQANTGGAGDPADPGSWNPYAYVAGDPINRNDKAGLFYANNPDGGGPGTDPTDPGTGDPIGGCGVPGCNQAKPRRPLHGTQMQGGGSSQTSKITTVTNFSTTSAQAVVVQNDLRWLQQAIQTDPTCSGWLQGSYDAINFMLDVPGSGATAVAVGVGNFPAGTNAVAGNGGTNLPAGTLITVALNGAFFNAGPSSSVGFGLPSWITGGSSAAQAEILLHELAHDIGAAGMEVDGPLKNGQPNVAAQTNNNGLVMQYCGGVVALAGGMN